MAKFDKLAVMAKIGQTGMVPVFYHQDLDVCKNVVNVNNISPRKIGNEFVNVVIKFAL